MGRQNNSHRDRNGAEGLLDRKEQTEELAGRGTGDGRN
jgi:hypothetical protein